MKVGVGIALHWVRHWSRNGNAQSWANNTTWAWGISVKSATSCFETVGVLLCGFVWPVAQARRYEANKKCHQYSRRPPFKFQWFYHQIASSGWPSSFCRLSKSTKHDTQSIVIDISFWIIKARIIIRLDITSFPEGALWIMSLIL